MVEKVDALLSRVPTDMLPRTAVSGRPVKRTRAAIVRVLVERGIKALELELSKPREVTPNGHSRSAASGA